MITRSGFLLTNRENKAGQPLGFQALLCAVRGDLIFYRSDSIFLVGTHFLAYVAIAIERMQSCEKLDLMRDGGTDYLSHWDIIHCIRRNNVEVSPLFSSPFLKGSCFKTDWLHAVDQGVGADVLGKSF